jgi:hypothetical protein
MPKHSQLSDLEPISPQSSFSELEFTPSPSQSHLPDILPTAQVATNPPAFKYPDFTLAPARMASTPIHSVLTMPIPGTKLAPEKFRGDYSKVKDFIEHYDRLIIQHSVLTHKERCETIRRYCGRREKETIMNIPSYSIPDWTRLREDILKVYDADRDTKRYTIKDVMKFVRRKQRRRISDLAAWKQYVRSFLRIAGSLLKNGKLTTAEHATYFWKGIPRIMRIRLENRILAADPGRNLTNPFTVNEVNLAAEALLQRDRFDGAIEDTDEEGESMREEESSDEETSDSESEDDRKYKKKSIKRKGKSPRKSKIVEESSDDEPVRKTKPDSPRRKVTSSRPEVEGLIRQLNSMSVDDPGYGLTYYRAIKLDDEVDKVVRAPSLNAIALAPNRYPERTYPRANNYIPVRPSMSAFRTQATGSNTSAPPHIASASAYPKPPMGESARRGDIKCYGCGEAGHGMSACQKINDQITRGLLTRDNSGRVVRSDGTRIQRFGSETFMEAIEREQRPQSHLVTIVDEPYDNSSDSSDLESQDEGMTIEYEDVFIVQDGRYETYAADKTEKKGTAKRREVMDGVYLPPGNRRSERNKKEKENDDVPRVIERLATPSKPSPKPVPRRMDPAPPVASETQRKLPTTRISKQPVVEQVPRYDPQNDMDVIEDKAMNELPRRPLQPRNQTTEGQNKHDQRTMGDKKPTARQSAVSAQVDPMSVMNQLLNTRVSLAVGEVLGISKELSSLVTDSIRVKAVKPPTVPVALAAVPAPPIRGPLIKINVECNGRPIEAIIDTGSQLNIVGRETYDSQINLPNNVGSRVTISDANGGERALEGLVESVPLTCGGVLTQAHLYVSDEVPFQLLLGRPWQRGNFVSIDERTDGTYLLFRDPKSSEHYEMKVAADHRTSFEWNYKRPSRAPSSYLVEVVKEEEEDKNDQKRQQAPADRSDHHQGIIPKWDSPDYSLIKKAYFDQGTIGLNYARYRKSERPAPLLQEFNWEGSTLGRKLWNDRDENKLPRDSSGIIKGEVVKKEDPHQNSEQIQQTNMSLNLTAVPITGHPEDLPVVYAMNAPARSEADAIRDALQHEGFLQEQGYFNNLALNSMQAFVTGYHMDNEGNTYTAITGLRSVRSVSTPSGPQTVYGHFTAHLYTRLEPVPSSVIIPTFFQPTSRVSSDCIVQPNNQLMNPRFVQRNVQALDNDGPDAVTPDLEVDRSTQVPPTPRLEHVSPPYLPPAPPVSRAESDSSLDSDDENWLPCSVCHATHGDIACSNRELALVRVSSTGSVSSSIHLPDDSAHVVKNESTDQGIHGRSVADLSDCGSMPELVYLSDSSGAPVVSPPPSLLLRQDNYIPDSSTPLTIDPRILATASSSSQPQIRDLLFKYESDDSSDDDEDYGRGVLELWKEYRKELSYETIVSIGGKSPMEIISDLTDEKFDELAERVFTQEALQGLASQEYQRDSINPPTGSLADVGHIRRTFDNDYVEPFNPKWIPNLERKPPNSALAITESPMEISPLDMQYTGARTQVLMEGIDDYTSQIPETSTTIQHIDTHGRPISIPETFPFTYPMDAPSKIDSPIKIDPIYVFTAKISDSQDDSHTVASSSQSHGNRSGKVHPQQLKYKAFPYIPPTVPTLPYVFTNLSGSQDHSHTLASSSQSHANRSVQTLPSDTNYPADSQRSFEIGAAPVSPSNSIDGTLSNSTHFASTTTPAVAQPSTDPFAHPGFHHQEMEPVLQSIQEHDTPPGLTPPRSPRPRYVPEFSDFSYFFQRNILEEGPVRPRDVGSALYYQRRLWLGQLPPDPTQPAPELTREALERALTHLELVFRDDVTTHPFERPDWVDEYLLPATTLNTPNPIQHLQLTGEALDVALKNIQSASAEFARQIVTFETQTMQDDSASRSLSAPPEYSPATASTSSVAPESDPFTNAEYQVQYVRSDIMYPRRPLGRCQKSHLFKVDMKPRTDPSQPKSEGNSDDSLDSQSNSRGLTTSPLPPSLQDKYPWSQPSRSTDQSTTSTSIRARRSLRDTPMGLRPYRPDYDNRADIRRPRIGQVIALDIRKLLPVTGLENPPVANAYIRYVTIMVGAFEPYIFPEVVHNTPSGPYNLPTIQCATWGQRVDRMFEGRLAVRNIIERVTNAIPSHQLEELRRPLITMFLTDSSGALRESTLDRQFFFSTLHPCFNPFLRPSEATFLRGACYHFRQLQQNVMADAVDVLLRSPQYDDFYCRKLLEIGCLEQFTPFQHSRALEHIQVYEDELVKAREGSSDDEDDEDMDSDYGGLQTN